MTTKAVAATAPATPIAAAEKKEVAPSCVVLFELDQLIGHARKAAYEVLKSILDEKGIAFAPVQFSRHCLASRPDFYIEEVQNAVGAKKLSTKKLIEDVSNGIALRMASSNLTLPGPLKKLFEKTRDKGGRVVALTLLPEAIRNALSTRLGLADLGVTLAPFEHHEANWPRADLWLKLVKENGVSTLKSVALATSATACKSALTAGCRVVVIPDEFPA
jgi:beta-phosphoglucomutase-like phosphatase (HAD superfamily)